MNLFSQLREKLSKTRQRLADGIDSLLSGRRGIDEATLEELEGLLLSCDLGVKTTLCLMEKVKREAREVGLVKIRIKEEILNILMEKRPSPLIPHIKPFIIMMVGVNGVGKTTTIAKLAHHLRSQGKEVVLAAADTFRPAAIEQLEIWGKKIGVEVVRQNPGADPAAVAFDAVRRAKSKGADIIIADTAGRLHTKYNLMEELKKVHRILGREMEGAPHEVLLVIDATTGQNAIEQARRFHEAVGVTGIALAKLDGTAKGGIVVAITEELGIPIKFIGIGEGLDDLRAFDPKEFVEALF